MKPGDVVVLKSDETLKLTVSSVGDGSVVVWWLKDGGFVRGEVPSAILKKTK